MEIKIAEIKISPDRDPIVEATVSSLMGSIKDVGLINAITVNKDMALIAGAHRLEACKRLGWKEIEANVVTLDDLRAELAEIDENLIRNTYTDYIVADEKMLRRKEIYEALHPETKAGQAQAISMNRTLGNDVTAETATTFNTDVMQKTGIPERTLRKSIQRARDITPAAKEEIRKVGLGKEKAVEVARTAPEQQVEKVRELAQKPAPKPPVTPVEFINPTIPPPPPGLDEPRMPVTRGEQEEYMKNLTVDESTIAVVIDRQTHVCAGTLSEFMKLIKEQSDHYVENMRRLLATNSSRFLAPDMVENKQKTIVALSECEAAIHKMKELLA